MRKGRGGGGWGRRTGYGATFGAVNTPVAGRDPTTHAHPGPLCNLARQRLTTIHYLCFSNLNAMTTRGEEGGLQPLHKDFTCAMELRAHHHGPSMVQRKRHAPIVADTAGLPCSTTGHVGRAVYRHDAHTASLSPVAVHDTCYRPCGRSVASCTCASLKLAHGVSECHAAAPTSAVTTWRGPRGAPVTIECGVQLLPPPRFSYHTRDPSK